MAFICRMLAAHTGIAMQQQANQINRDPAQPEVHRAQYSPPVLLDGFAVSMLIHHHIWNRIGVFCRRGMLLRGQAVGNAVHKHTSGRAVSGSLAAPRRPQPPFVHQPSKRLLHIVASSEGPEPQDDDVGKLREKFLQQQQPPSAPAPPPDASSSSAEAPRASTQASGQNAPPPPPQQQQQQAQQESTAATSTAQQEQQQPKRSRRGRPSRARSSRGGGEQRQEQP
eukprot:595701-Pelagomonas_calceolata.AAC.4